MQSKLAHAAERKAFEIAINTFLNSTSGKDREESLQKILGMAEKVLTTTPYVVDGLRKALKPGSKWENYLFDVIV